MINRSIFDYQSMKNLGGGTYACKWGITDFYPEEESKMRSLIESRKDFAVYAESKKEIETMYVVSKFGKLHIMVSSGVDDLPDMISLLLEDSGKEFDDMEDVVDLIMDAFQTDNMFTFFDGMSPDYESNAFESMAVVENDLSWEEFVDLAESLEKQANEYADNYYHIVEKFTFDWLEYHRQHWTE